MSHHGVVATVPNLLKVIVGLATVTLGVLGFDAERAIGQLQATALSVQQTRETVASMSTKVDRLDTTTNKLASMVDDHEKRITIIETMGNVKPR